MVELFKIFRYSVLMMFEWAHIGDMADLEELRTLLINEINNIFVDKIIKGKNE